MGKLIFHLFLASLIITVVTPNHLPAAKDDDDDSTSEEFSSEKGERTEEDDNVWDDHLVPGQRRRRDVEQAPAAENANLVPQNPDVDDQQFQGNEERVVAPDLTAMFPLGLQRRADANKPRVEDAANPVQRQGYLGAGYPVPYVPLWGGYAQGYQQYGHPWLPQDPDLPSPNWG